MALVRCENCGVQPAGHGKYTRSYVQYVQPVGHPTSAIICGTPSCHRSGLIWLEKPEYEAYRKGERIFSLQTNTTKVQAQ
jgi:hypothetical protein